MGIPAARAVKIGQVQYVFPWKMLHTRRAMWRECKRYEYVMGLESSVEGSFWRPSGVGEMYVAAPICHHREFQVFPFPELR